jgi:hypothetical protein
MLEERCRAGASEAAELASARLSWVGGEGCIPGRVVDVEVVAVPVAAMCLQPSFLLPPMSACLAFMAQCTYGYGADEEAARGEVNVLRGRMLLWLESTFLLRL